MSNTLCSGTHKDKTYANASVSNASDKSDSSDDEHQEWSDADSIIENILESDASSIAGQQNEESDASSIDSQQNKERENREDYYDKLFSSNLKLHPNLNCTVGDCMVILLIIFIRHNLSWECLMDVIEMVNTVVGASVIPKSKYLFKKYFPFHIQPKYQYYCTVCNNTLESKNEKICSICNKNTASDISKGHNFFVTLPIAEQIRLILKKNFKFIKKIDDSNEISDVLYGQRYQKLCRNVKNLISLTFNVDGIKMFKSTKKGEFWPIQFTINELDEKVRFNRANIIVCGFWFGKHPNIEQFFKSLLLDLKTLNDEPLTFTSAGISHEFNVQVFIFLVLLIFYNSIRLEKSFIDELNL